MIFPSFTATLSGMFHVEKSSNMLKNLAKMKKRLVHFVLEKAKFSPYILIPLPKPETHVCH